MSPHRNALQSAAILLRDPVCVTRMRAEPLPDGVSTVLAVLVGDAEAEVEAVRVTGKPLATIREAAEFYVNQVLLHSTSDPYRLLGARPSASRGELRSNLALLLRWLRPDVAGTKNRVSAERVIHAWNSLKAPDRRDAVDRTIEKHRDADRQRRVDASRRRHARRTGARLLRRFAARTGPVALPASRSRRKRLFGVVGLGALIGSVVVFVPVETVLEARKLIVSLPTVVSALATGAFGPSTQDNEPDP